MSQEYPTRESFGFVSSGDPEEDDRIADQLVVREKRLIEGICANGCGPMVREDAHTRSCPKCRFRQWSNVVLK